MKTLILALFFTSSILYSASPELIDGLGENITPQIEPMQEIGSLEIPSLSQQSIVTTDLEMPIACFP